MVTLRQSDWIRRGLFAAGLSAEAALSWLFGHNEPWETVEGMLLVFGGIFVLSTLFLAVRDRERGYLRLAAGTVAIYLAWLVPGTLWPDERVMIDNFSDFSLRIRLDERAWATLDPRSGTERRLRGGTYLVTVSERDGAKELERREIKVEARGYAEKGKVFVLNVMGLGSYRWDETIYGGSSDNLRPGRVISEPWFGVEASYVFQMPPNVLPVKRGQSITVTYIERLSGELAAVP